MLLRNFSVKLKYFRANFRSVSTKTSSELLLKWKDKFQNAQIENAEFCIKCIVAHVLNTQLKNLHVDRIQISPEQAEKIEQLCECRLARMPLQYILGEWDFMDSTLKLTPPVFIPRPETEGLVQLVLRNICTENPQHFLEVGCGSGAICLSILKAAENSTCIALDCSKIACELTVRNSKDLGLSKRLSVRQHRVSDNELLPKDFDGKFDFIVSNPPYIKTSDLHQLAPEILYENVTALDGGPDGLKVARNICQIASSFLRSGGRLWMEVDSCHPPVLEEIIRDKFSDCLNFRASYEDIFGKPRFVEIIKL